MKNSVKKVHNSFDSSKKVLGIKGSLNKKSMTRLFSYNFEIVTKKANAMNPKATPIHSRNNSRNNSRNVSKTSIKKDFVKLTPNTKTRFYSTSNDRSEWKNNNKSVQKQNT